MKITWCAFIRGKTQIKREMANVAIGMKDKKKIHVNAAAVSECRKA